MINDYGSKNLTNTENWKKDSGSHCYESNLIPHQVYFVFFWSFAFWNEEREKEQKNPS